MRLAGGAIVWALLVAALSGAPAAQPAAAPDLVLVNGRVVTVDRAFAVAEAVAVTGDRITAVGTSARIRALAGSGTTVIDLRGGALIPGLMDNHLHSAGGGPGVDLSRARSLDDVYSAVATRVRQTAAGEVVVSNSDWHEAQLREKRLPLRDDLDKVAPNHPVVLVRGGHEYVVNSAALRRWQIDEKTPEPAGGRLTRYPDGRLNGELVDTAKAFVKLPPAPPRSRDARIAARVAEYATLHAAGLTTVRHPGISVDDYQVLQEMQRRGLLTMRVNALLRPGGSAQAVTSALDASGLEQGDGDAWLRVGGVKLAVDGGFEGGLMREPYAEPWDEKGTFKGLQTQSTESFESTVLALNDRGWRVATHAVGDAAIDMVLAAYERANARKSIVGRRWSIEHAFIGRPDHLPRIKALGLALAVQNHLYLAGPSLVSYWGPVRAGITTPARLYLDAGLPVSSGTDAPVVPYPPLWTLYHFITRDTIAGGVLGPAQRVTREEALRMATTGNAWLTMEEADKGTIEPGKLADLVLLSEDPLTCAPQALRDAQVLLTVVGGKIVHDARH
ncbi:MAG TPA: amidohydrolase [Vicinamibacterales bacterium]|nr:amidohydrolase [Vicinamibacterales bacterium]